MTPDVFWYLPMYVTYAKNLACIHDHVWWFYSNCQTLLTGYITADIISHIFLKLYSAFYLKKDFHHKFSYFSKVTQTPPTHHPLSAKHDKCFLLMLLCQAKIEFTPLQVSG